MAFQFVHTETYGRKAGANARRGGATSSFVLDEAERLEHAATHVEAPQRPRVKGWSIERVRAEHDRLAGEARTTTSAGRTRKIRQDQHTLHTEVASHPYSPDDLADQRKRREYEAWRNDTIRWWRQRLGDNLVSVVEHRDEQHLHLHALALPRDDPEMRAKRLHPGYAAQEQARGAARQRGADGKVVRKEGDNAYRAAMRRYQDDYWEKVGRRHGLARIGPGRRRLSREAWRVEQQQVQRTAELERKAAKASTAMKQAQAARDAARQAAAEAKARADAAEPRTFPAKAGAWVNRLVRWASGKPLDRQIEEARTDGRREAESKLQPELQRLEREAERNHREKVAAETEKRQVQQRAERLESRVKALDERLDQVDPERTPDAPHSRSDEPDGP